MSSVFGSAFSRFTFNPNPTKSFNTPQKVKLTDCAMRLIDIKRALARIDISARTFAALSLGIAIDSVTVDGDEVVWVVNSTEWSNAHATAGRLRVNFTKSDLSPLRASCSLKITKRSIKIRGGKRQIITGWYIFSFLTIDLQYP